MWNESLWQRRIITAATEVLDVAGYSHFLFHLQSWHRDILGLKILSGEAPRWLSMAKHPALDFSTGHDLRNHGMESHVRLHTEH